MAQNGSPMSYAKAARRRNDGGTASVAPNKFTEAFPPTTLSVDTDFPSASCPSTRPEGQSGQSWAGLFRKSSSPKEKESPEQATTSKAAGQKVDETDSKVSPRDVPKKSYAASAAANTPHSSPPIPPAEPPTGQSNTPTVPWVYPTGTVPPSKGTVPQATVSPCSQRGPNPLYYANGRPPHMQQSYPIYGPNSCQLQSPVSYMPNCAPPMYYPQSPQNYGPNYPVSSINGSSAQPYCGPALLDPAQLQHVQAYQHPPPGVPYQNYPGLPMGPPPFFPLSPPQQQACPPVFSTSHTSRSGYAPSASRSSVSLKITDFPPSTSFEEKTDEAVMDSDWNRAVAKMERENRIRAKIGLVINKRYQVLQKINVGSYGQLYTALDMLDPLSKQVAIKFESSGVEDSHIRYEYEVFKVCAMGPHSKKEKTTIGFPQVYWIGEEYNYKIMVMELLGPSLENLFGFCSNQFRKETVYQLGCQMVDRIEHLHNRGFVHRDLKPENILMGIGNNENTCYLIDFGLARRYRFRDGSKLTHIPYRKGKHLVGTAKYASLNSHNGIELSRRDDMESLGYILLEFMTGDLPWKESRARARYRTKQQSYNRIRTGKEQMDWESGCPALAEWMKYAKGLRFEEKPDYSRFRQFLCDYMEGKYVEVNHDDGLTSEMNQLELGEKDGESLPADKANGVPPMPPAVGDTAPTGDEAADRAGAVADGQTGMDGEGTSTNGEAGPSSSASCSPKMLRGLSPRVASRVAANRFDWLERRERSANEKYTYQCMYRWTLPYGEKPELPPDYKSSMSFGYGFGEGGFA